jgi:hypothetical protein
MKRIIVFAIVAVLLISSVTAVFVASTVLLANKNKEFYVGVTFCGNTTADAKLLVDKVADYTNLFMLQSGPLMDNITATYEIGDYATAKGLHFAAYFDPGHPAQNAMWLGNATQRWGSMFAGVYYGDEPGGKMLDTNIDLTDRSTQIVENGLGGTSTIITISSQSMLVKLAGGGLQTSYGTFYPNGTITVQKSSDTFSSETDPDNSSITISNTLSNTNLTTYDPNGSITVRETITRAINKVYTVGWPSHLEVGSSYQVLRDNFYTMENGSDRLLKKKLTSK